MLLLRMLMLHMIMLLLLLLLLLLLYVCMASRLRWMHLMRQLKPRCGLRRRPRSRRGRHCTAPDATARLARDSAAR